MSSYKIYGLQLKSNVALEGLIRIDDNEEPYVDLVVNGGLYKGNYFDEELIYSSSGIAENNLPYLSVWFNKNDLQAYLTFRITNGQDVSFTTVNQDGSRITSFVPSSMRFQDFLSYLTGPIIGCVLALKSYLCLHASVVNIEGRAIGFIGDKGAGKSTLIAKLASRGFSVVSDDICVLRPFGQSWVVQPGYPRLRLWRNSFDVLKGISINSSSNKVLGSIDKYYLDLDIRRNAQRFKFDPFPRELLNIYFLSNEKTSEDTISILSNVNAFLMLQKNVYASYLNMSEILSFRFNAIKKLPLGQNIKSISRPFGLNHIDDTINCIIKDVSISL